MHAQTESNNVVGTYFLQGVMETASVIDHISQGTESQ